MQPVKGNKYGRTEEVLECEDCNNCKYKNDCCPKACLLYTSDAADELITV